jgi:L-asparaginase
VKIIDKTRCGSDTILLPVSDRTDMPSSKPKVRILATGGTIANPPDTNGYLSGRELVNRVPEVEKVANVTVTDIASTGSSGMTTSIWWALHEEISDAAASTSPPDGVVITHGSNTVEETAYFLHLTLKTAMPVVLTAAQRNHDTLGNDGDRNLLDAVKIASHSEARGRGVLVVLNDEIHSARDVTKDVSGRPDAWSSSNFGVLGLVDKRNNIEFLRETMKRHAPDTAFDVTDASPEAFPRVEIIYAAAGDDGTMARAAVDNGAEGLVLAGFPTGSPADPAGYDGQATVLREMMDEGVPVVLSHRGHEGWPYPREGFIWGHTLSPQKARILLALGLMTVDGREGGNHERLREFFTTY